MKIFADYHTHTKYSHGHGTVEENVAVAFEQGLGEVAISDHGPGHMFGIGMKNMGILKKIRQEALSAEKKYSNIKVLVGVEANVTCINGDIDVPESFLGNLDILLVGLHLMVRPVKWLDGLNRFGWHYLSGINASLEKKSRVLNTEAIINAVYKYPIDIITHPGQNLNIDTIALAKACVERKTALEINASHNHITSEYVRLAAEQGVEFVISSDAHSPKQVGHFAKAVSLAEEAGLTERQVRNAVK